MKTKTNMDERIWDIAAPIAKDLGYALVRVRVQGGNRPVVQIMAERGDGTMSVDDCAILSRELSSTFEVEDPIDGAYILEVSSPGLDRPLTDMEHFERYKGMLARIELDRLVEGQKRFRGKLAGLDGDNIAIDLDNEKETALIPFEWISDAKLLITNSMIKKGPKEKQAKKENKKSKNSKSKKGDT